MTIEVTHHRSFAEIDPAIDLTAHSLGPEYSRAWMRAFAELAPYYVLVRDAEGPAALAVAYHHPAPNPATLTLNYDPFRSFFAESNELAADDFYPLLIAGARGNHNRLLIRPSLGGEEREEVVTALTQGLREVAQQLGSKIISFPFLPTSDLVEVTEKIDPALPALHFPNLYLPVPDSFEEYLSQLDSDRRWMVKKEMRRFREAGYTVTQSPLHDRMDQVAHLHHENMHKHLGAIENLDLYAAANLKVMAALPRECSLLLEAHRNGAAEAMFVIQELDQQLYGGAFGMEGSADRGARVYFNLIFYAAIEEAITRRSKKIHYTAGSEEPKLIRGCRLDPLSTVIWPQHDGPWQKARVLLQEQSERQMKVLYALVRRYGKHQDQVEEDLSDAMELYL